MNGGVLRFHDITYRLLGLILKSAIGSMAWSTNKLADAVLKQLSTDEVEALRKQNKDPEKEIKRLIYYSKRTGYVNEKLQTTRKGSTKLKQLNFHLLDMTKPWDGKWRLVMYDVPESQRNVRDQIRRLIKQLGFVQLQRSVWVHPLPCLEEFEIIKKANSLGNSLILLETSKLPEADNYLNHFRSIYPKL